MGLQDEFYIRHMIKNKLFEPILNIVIETMPRDNLLNSACLEFFEFIKRVSAYLIHFSPPCSRFLFFDVWRLIEFWAAGKYQADNPSHG